MTSLPTASVIIPTYNRKDLLRDTLESLAQQTYPRDRFEVIIVDDGSTDGTKDIAREAFGFSLRYLWQRNQGDAAARNFGARHSQAEILVFLDDDILLELGYLTNVIQAQAIRQDRIVAGTWNLWRADTSPLANSLHHSLSTGALQAGSSASLGAAVSDSGPGQALADLPFSDVSSNNMALWREAYFDLGMMQGLDFPGSSMWCDLDFAYRAYRQGFEFRRSTHAICWHRDHVAYKLDDYKKRERTAAYRAVVLFEKYPELINHLPMFSDKTPIAWGQDRPRLIARKLARSMASSRLALWSLERLAAVLEAGYPASSLLPTLYRYIVGGHVFQGYREGLTAKFDR